MEFNNSSTVTKQPTTTAFIKKNSFVANSTHSLTANHSRKQSSDKTKQVYRSGVSKKQMPSANKHHQMIFFDNPQTTQKNLLQSPEVFDEQEAPHYFNQGDEYIDDAMQDNNELMEDEECLDDVNQQQFDNDEIYVMQLRQQSTKHPFMSSEMMNAFSKNKSGSQTAKSCQKQSSIANKWINDFSPNKKQSHLMRSDAMTSQQQHYHRIQSQSSRVSSNFGKPKQSNENNVKNFEHKSSSSQIFFGLKNTIDDIEKSKQSAAQNGALINSYLNHQQQLQKVLEQDVVINQIGNNDPQDSCIIDFHQQEQRNCQDDDILSDEDFNSQEENILHSSSQSISPEDKKSHRRGISQQRLGSVKGELVKQSTLTETLRQPKTYEFRHPAQIDLLKDQSSNTDQLQASNEQALRMKLTQRLNKPTPGIGSKHKQIPMSKYHSETVEDITSSDDENINSQRQLEFDYLNDKTPNQQDQYHIFKENSEKQLTERVVNPSERLADQPFNINSTYQQVPKSQHQLIERTNSFGGITQKKASEQYFPKEQLSNKFQEIQVNHNQENEKRQIEENQDAKLKKKEKVKEAFDQIANPIITPSSAVEHEADPEADLLLQELQKLQSTYRNMQNQKNPGTRKNRSKLGRQDQVYGGNSQQHIKSMPHSNAKLKQVYDQLKYRKNLKIADFHPPDQEANDDRSQKRSTGMGTSSSKRGLLSQQQSTKAKDSIAKAFFKNDNLVKDSQKGKIQKNKLSQQYSPRRDVSVYKNTNKGQNQVLMEQYSKASYDRLSDDESSNSDHHPAKSQRSAYSKSLFKHTHNQQVKTTKRQHRHQHQQQQCVDDQSDCENCKDASYNYNNEDFYAMQHKDRTYLESGREESDENPISDNSYYDSNNSYYGEIEANGYQQNQTGNYSHNSSERRKRHKQKKGKIQSSKHANKNKEHKLKININMNGGQFSRQMAQKSHEMTNRTHDDYTMKQRSMMMMQSAYPNPQVNMIPFQQQQLILQQQLALQQQLLIQQQAASQAAALQINQQFYNMPAPQIQNQNHMITGQNNLLMDVLSPSQTTIHPSFQQANTQMMNMKPQVTDEKPTENAPFILKNLSNKNLACFNQSLAANVIHKGQKKESSPKRYMHKNSMNLPSIVNTTLTSPRDTHDRLYSRQVVEENSSMHKESNNIDYLNQLKSRFLASSNNDKAENFYSESKDIESRTTHRNVFNVSSSNADIVGDQNNNQYLGAKDSFNPAYGKAPIPRDNNELLYSQNTEDIDFTIDHSQQPKFAQKRTGDFKRERKNESQTPVRSPQFMQQHSQNTTLIFSKAKDAVISNNNSLNHSGLSLEEGVKASNAHESMQKSPKVNQLYEDPTGQPLPYKRTTLNKAKQLPKTFDEVKDQDKKGPQALCIGFDDEVQLKDPFKNKPQLKSRQVIEKPSNTSVAQQRSKSTKGVSGIITAKTVMPSSGPLAQRRSPESKVNGTKIQPFSKDPKTNEKDIKSLNQTEIKSTAFNIPVEKTKSIAIDIKSANFRVNKMQENTQANEEDDKDPNHNKNLVIEILDKKHDQQKEVSLAEMFKARAKKEAKQMEQDKAVQQEIDTKNAGEAKKKEKSKEELAELRKQMMKSKVKRKEDNFSAGAHPNAIPDASSGKDAKKEPSLDLQIRLAKGEKVQVDKKEMKRLTQKNYQNLPEIKKKQEEEKKRQENLMRKQAAQEYMKQLKQKQRQIINKKKKSITDTID